MQTFGKQINRRFRAPAAAIGLSLLLAAGARLWGLQGGGAAVLIGLAAGWTAAAASCGTFKQAALLGGASALLGAGLFFLLVGAPSGRHVPPLPVEEEQRDDLAVRVVALRLCRDRNIRTVFDFQDVPDAIRREAADIVQQMPVREKEAIFRRTFTARITPHPQLRGRTFGSTAGWTTTAVLAAALSAWGTRTINRKEVI